jgi:peptide-methionine (S)-S-oxide reductase
MTPNHPIKTEIATLGGGCFWCVEACFLMLKGVLKVTSGYAGGAQANTYQEVCQGDTGHAEVVQIEFDPQQITFERLLDAFFILHDPTQLNRQGADVGTQYRSVIFYHDEAQAEVAKAQIIKQSPKFASAIVTELSPAPEFYPAEAYHHNYFAQNPTQPYCSAVVGPKVAKFKKYFGLADDF